MKPPKTDIPLTIAERKLDKLTPAQRQQRQRAKLKNSYHTLQVLQSDLNTAEAIIDATKLALSMLAFDSPDSKSLHIAMRQLENALHYINPNRGGNGFRRRESDVSGCTKTGQVEK